MSKGRYFSRLHDFRMQKEDPEAWQKAYDDAYALGFDEALSRIKSSKIKGFIIAYLRRSNATQAARDAGYGHANSEDAYFSTKGWELKRMAEVRAIIDLKLDESILTLNETLSIFSQQATASVEDFYDFPDEGPPLLNLAKAKERGVLHLIQSIKPLKDGGWDLKLYNAQTAATRMGSNHGAFKDITEHRGSIRFEDTSITDEERKARVNKLLEPKEKGVS